MKRNTRATALLIILFSIASLAIACARPPARGVEILIGAIGAMTGPSAELGNNLRQGVDMAVEKINASGGINGRKVRVIYRDDEGDPTKAVAELQDLVTRGGVVAIIGPTNTAVAAAILPYVQEARIVHMIGGSTGTTLIDHQRYPYTFRTIYNNEMMAMEMVTYAVKIRGWQRLAILHDKTVLGVGGADDLQRFTRAVGLTPVIIENYNSGDSDLLPQIGHIRDVEPDAILSWALGADTARALRAMQQLNYKVPYIGYAGSLLRSTRDLAGDALGDALATSPSRFVWSVDPQQLDPAVREFIADQEKTFGADNKVSISGVATHYDAMMLLAEAIRRAKSTSSPAVRATLETIKDFHGVATDYTYGPNDHEGFDEGGISIVYIAAEWKGTHKAAATR